MFYLTLGLSLIQKLQNIVISKFIIAFQCVFVLVMLDVRLGAAMSHLHLDPAGFVYVLSSLDWLVCVTSCY